MQIKRPIILLIIHVCWPFRDFQDASDRGEYSDKMSASATLVLYWFAETTASSPDRSQRHPVPTIQLYPPPLTGPKAHNPVSDPATVSHHSKTNSPTTPHPPLSPTHTATQSTAYQPPDFVNILHRQKQDQLLDRVMRGLGLRR